MLLFFLAFAFITVGSIQARTFNNPITGNEDRAHPGVIKVNGTYYLVASNQDVENGMFPIYTSLDLLNWKQNGYVFTDANAPTWPKNHQFFNGEIHKIGSNYIFYFSGYASNGLASVGTAIASRPNGPYTPTDRPLLSGGKVYDPTVIHDGDKLYLAWSDEKTILARQLNSDGLSFYSDQAVALLSASLTWETTHNDSPWHIRRGNYHYIIYSGNSWCGSGYSTGVARSLNALGPYEKLSNPIISSNSKFAGTGHVSVVKDLDEKTDVVFFQGFRRNEVCGDWPRLILLASLVWDENDWPYLIDF